MHVGCAHKAGWTMGFDIQPVKGSRRELVSTVKLGNEQGTMTAAVWCPEHDVKSTVHPIGEYTEETGLVWSQHLIRSMMMKSPSWNGFLIKRLVLL